MNRSNNEVEIVAPPQRDTIWPRSTTFFLLIVGFLLATCSFIVVINMPELPWHTADDRRLRDAYELFKSSGALGIKTHADALTSLGGLSPISQTTGLGPILLASLLGAAVGFPSPYSVLGAAQAILVALPLVWLPLATARIFRRARAGYALVLLPPLVWLLNSGTILVGTQYGLSDEISSLRVPTLYGMPASLGFLALSLVVLASTYHLRLSRLIVVSILLAFLTGLIALFDWYTAIGAALSIAVLWWIRLPRRGRLLRFVAAAAAAVVISVGTQGVISAAVESTWAQTDGLPAVAPASIWDDLYAGLAYPESVGGHPSTLNVPATDSGIRAEVQKNAPGAELGSPAHKESLRELYFSTLESHAAEAIGLYVHKALFVIKHFGAMISFTIIGFVLALTRRAPQRRALAAAFAIAFPSLVLGFLVPIAATPDLYSFGQLSSSLGLLTAVALGAIVWSITSMPSHVRSIERSRLSARVRALTPPPRAFSPGTALSVIVPTRNGVDVLGETLEALGARLQADDEIIIVENGSTDGTTDLLLGIQAQWTHPSTVVVTHSSPGLGEALRIGVLSSKGEHLLLTADDLPFGFTDLDEFEALPPGVAVAIGSKAHPRSRVTRSLLRTIQSRIFRFLREALLQSQVGDSQGTLWVDGIWGREFAHLSRESGLMWTTELVLAAEQQNIDVREVPVALSNRHESGSSRFRLSDAWQSVVGFTRLAVYKDDYCNEDWIPSTRPNHNADAAIPTS